MKESNKCNGLVHGPTCTTWPPPWLVDLREHPAPCIQPEPNRVDVLPDLPAPGRQSEAARLLAEIKVKAERIRKRKFVGTLQDCLGRVLDTYLELAEEHAARLDVIRLQGFGSCMDDALANCRELAGQTG